MIKIIWLLRRKQGTGFEAFQEHYERSHSELGKIYFGHLIKAYRRNYNDRRIKDTTSPSVAKLMAAKEWEFEDEEHFLDLNSTRYFMRCATRDTGVLSTKM